VRRRPGQVLAAEEIESVVRVALREGVTKIKLTGGEPMLYRSGDNDVVALVQRLAGLCAGSPGRELSMTTNGSLLQECATRLRAAGLSPVTMSLTTLDPGTFHGLIARNKSLLDRSIAGLDAARKAGLGPLKINAVLYFSAERRLGNLYELPDLVRLATANDVRELRFFTLLAHDTFSDFDEFYQFFSRSMCDGLRDLLDSCGVAAAAETVEVLSALAVIFAHHPYPKAEFGVDLGSIRLGFEAMKYGRLAAIGGLQEGPYAMRLGSDGGLRSTLDGRPSYKLIDAIRGGCPEAELRDFYRAALEEMP
jgi:hypothetical protein